MKFIMLSLSKSSIHPSCCHCTQGGCCFCPSCPAVKLLYNPTWTGCEFFSTWSRGEWQKEPLVLKALLTVPNSRSLEACKVLFSVKCEEMTSALGVSGCVSICFVHTTRWTRGKWRRTEWWVAAVGSLSGVLTLRLVFSMTGENHFLCPLVQHIIRKGEKFVEWSLETGWRLDSGFVIIGGPSGPARSVLLRVRSVKVSIVISLSIISTWFHCCVSWYSFYPVMWASLCCLVGWNPPEVSGQHDNSLAWCWTWQVCVLLLDEGWEPFRLKSRCRSGCWHVEPMTAEGDYKDFVD